MSDRITPVCSIKNHLFLGLRSSNENNRKNEDKKNVVQKSFAEHLKEKMGDNNGCKS